MLQPQSHHERTASLSTGPSTGSMIGWEHRGCSSMPHHARSSGRPTYTWGPSKRVFSQLGHPRKWGLAYRVQQINRGLVQDCRDIQGYLVDVGHQSGTDAVRATRPLSEVLMWRGPLIFSDRNRARPTSPRPALYLPAACPDLVSTEVPGAMLPTGRGPESCTGKRRFRMTPMWWVRAVSSWPM